MAFDRSKFKKTNLNEIDDSVKAAQSTMKSQNFNSDYARFFVMKDPGKYTMRILPSIDGTPYRPCKTVKLPIECPVYDKEGKDTGKKEIRTKDIFTSDVHCKNMKGKDAALIYIDYVMNLANEIQDKDERNKFLYPINGYRGAGGKWVWGISPMLNQVAYVTPWPFEDNEVYRMNIQTKWWNRMKEISVEKSTDDVLSIDVFSDPEEGYPLSVNYTMENGKRVHTLDAVVPSRGQSWDEFFESTAIPDKTLDNLTKLPSLDELYVDTFSRKDWDMQLEGLQRIDEQNGYNIFSDEQFLDEIEALEKLVPEEGAVKKPSKKEVVEEKPKASAARTAPKPKAPAAPAAKTYPPLIKMKLELKEYIEAEYEGTEELPNLPLVELRKWYDLMNEGKLLPFEDYKEDGGEPDPSEAVDENGDPYPFNEGEETQEEESSPVTQASSVASDTRSRLAALRARTKK